MAAAEASGRARRCLPGTPALLRDRVFRRCWSASTVSMFGDQISGIALPLAAVLVLHAGAAQMGYLTALEWLPSLLFGLPARAWVDRRGRRRVTMIGADLGRAALFASIPACYLLHALTLPQLYTVAFAAGTLSIVFNVSDGTLFVSIVAPERYVDGQSLLYGSRALSFVAGPSVGGVLVQALSAPFAIAADALSFLGSAFFLGRIRLPEPPAEGGKGSVTAGVRYIAGSAIVRGSLIAFATVNFFNLMFNALYLLYAVRVLHLRPGVVGVLLGMAAVGGVLGALVTKPVAARIGTGWAFMAGCLLFTAPLLGWPLARGPMPAVLATLFAAELRCSSPTLGVQHSAHIPAASRGSRRPRRPPSGNCLLAVRPDPRRSRPDSSTSARTRRGGLRPGPGAAAACWSGSIATCTAALPPARRSAPQLRAAGAAGPPDGRVRVGWVCLGLRRSWPVAA
jgi:MFS family permease